MSWTHTSEARPTVGQAPFGVWLLHTASATVIHRLETLDNENGWWKPVEPPKDRPDRLPKPQVSLPEGAVWAFNGTWRVVVDQYFEYWFDQQYIGRCGNGATGIPDWVIDKLREAGLVKR